MCAKCSSRSELLGWSLPRGQRLQVVEIGGGQRLQVVEIGDRNCVCIVDSDVTF